MERRSKSDNNAAYKAGDKVMFAAYGDFRDAKPYVVKELKEVPQFLGETTLTLTDGNGREFTAYVDEVKLIEEK